MPCSGAFEGPEQDITVHSSGRIGKGEDSRAPQLISVLPRAYSWRPPKAACDAIERVQTWAHEGNSMRAMDMPLAGANDGPVGNMLFGDPLPLSPPRVRRPSSRDAGFQGPAPSGKSRQRDQKSFAIAARTDRAAQLIPQHRLAKIRLPRPLLPRTAPSARAPAPQEAMLPSLPPTAPACGRGPRGQRPRPRLGFGSLPRKCWRIPRSRFQPERSEVSQ